MALFWSVVSGEAEQQIEVPTTSVGSARMVAIEVTPGTLLPDGDFPGQLLFWDGAAWVPVPNQGGPTARAEGLNNVNELDPASLILGDGSVAITSTTAKMNSRLGNVIAQVTDNNGTNAEWQMAFADGETFTQILGDETTISLTANSTGGRITLNSHAATQVMEDGWSVTLGEGSPFVALDTIVGFIVQVTAGIDIALQNETGCQQSIQDEVFVFRTPDSGGTPTNNLTLSHDVDAPTVGFLGAGPVSRQSITGATTQDQVDSIVAALVALGLATDNRTSILKTHIGWAPTNAGDTSNLLTLMPAGHQPGLYRVGVCQRVRTASGAAFGQEVLIFSDGGAVSITGNATGTGALAWTGGVANEQLIKSMQYRSIYSDGINAITMQVTAQGTVATPVIDIYATIQR